MFQLLLTRTIRQSFAVPVETDATGGWFFGGPKETNPEG